MLNVNWLTLPKYFLRSILHSSLVGGEGTMENRVEAGGRTNKKKESQYCSQLTRRWPFAMLNDSLSPHHVSLPDRIAPNMRSSTYRPSPVLSCGLGWPPLPRRAPAPAPLRVLCNIPVLSRPPLFPDGSTFPMPLFYYEVHCKGCFTCLHLEVEILKGLRLREVSSLCKKKKSLVKWHKTS